MALITSQWTLLTKAFTSSSCVFWPKGVQKIRNESAATGEQRTWRYRHANTDRGHRESSSKIHEILKLLPAKLFIIKA
jgi:hypothetical protein